MGEHVKGLEALAKALFFSQYDVPEEDKERWWADVLNTPAVLDAWQRAARAALAHLGLRSAADVQKAREALKRGLKRVDALPDTTEADVALAALDSALRELGGEEAGG